MKTLNLDLRETLRWSDQIKIKKDVGEKIEDTEEEKKREEVSEILISVINVAKENDRLWELKDELASNLKNKDFKEILELNGYVIKKLSADSMIHKVCV